MLAHRQLLNEKCSVRYFDKGKDCYAPIRKESKYIVNFRQGKHGEVEGIITEKYTHKLQTDTTWWCPLEDANGELIYYEITDKNMRIKRIYKEYRFKNLLIKSLGACFDDGITIFVALWFSLTIVGMLLCMIGILTLALIYTFNIVKCAIVFEVIFLIFRILRLFMGLWGYKYATELRDRVIEVIKQQANEN